MPVPLISASGIQYGMIVNSDGSINTTASVSGTSIEDFTLRYTQKIDYSGTMQPIYIGLTLPGTNSGSAGWQIRKNTFDGNGLITDVQFASGNAQFDKIWDDRGSAPYA